MTIKEIRRLQQRFDETTDLLNYPRMDCDLQAICEERQAIENQLNNLSEEELEEAFCSNCKAKRDVYRCKKKGGYCWYDER